MTTTTITNGESGLSARTKLNDIWAKLELNAIAASKGVTAADVFVYDTSKDSDDGAWRKRTQHTSWYNETLNTATRGARREFPAAAVFVTESNKVTIYDGDDPALPMWMVFNTGASNLLGSNATMNSCVAFNGILVAGKTTAGIRHINFVSDASRYYSGDAFAGDFNGNIAGRNSGSETLTLNSANLIVNNTVNDVAMTVLPGAPVDPATGLPVPTIAVATAGGVSVITDSGAVYDSSATVEVKTVDINENILFFTRTAGASSAMPYFAPMPITSDGFWATTYRSVATSGGIPTMKGYPDKVLVGADESHLYTGSISGTSYSGGVTHLAHRPDNYLRSMVAYTTSTYNTGWMNGDIKGAFLSDTDDTDLVGSGELVTNGTFDTDTTGWTATGSTPAVLSQASGQMTVTGATTNSPHGAQQAFTTVAGKRYVATVDLISSSTVNRYFYIGTSAGIPNNLGFLSNTSFVVGKNQITFTAASTTTYISLFIFNVGDTLVVDNASVQLADADRSVNNKGLIVNGTVTRTAVATGADLVAYSGFSASNYLEQPYNSDLDFGTGDFCVMGWVNSTNASGADTILDRSASIGITGLYIYVQSGGNLAARVGAGAATDRIFGSVSNTGWRHFSVLRVSGRCYLYLDGRATLNFSETGNISGTSLATRVGQALDGSNAANATSLALLRISATAPTAEQIKKIYEDEKFLFQEGAQATLYGASDAVTALAHDPVTDLLHVGTSAGRSVFSGLRRVSNTTTAVGTAISASNGLVAEE